jgi:hypothetical protein
MMEWLTNNWLWVLLGIGFVWLVSRGGGMGCCGGGHSHGTPKENPQQEKQEGTAQTKRSCH